MNSSGASCQSFRFVMNNCYSGAMMESIFDANGKLLPNRCGSASTPRYEVSRGRPIKPLVPMQVRGHTVYGSPGARCNYTEHFARGLSQSPNHSLDDAHFHAIKEDETSEQPVLTSDYYLDKYNRDLDATTLIAAQKAIRKRVLSGMSCNASSMSGQPFQGVQSLSQQALAAADIAAAATDPAQAAVNQELVQDIQHIQN